MQNRTLVVVALLFAILLMISVAANLILLRKRRTRIFDGVVNYDAGMRIFVYRLYMSRARFCQKMLRPTEIEGLSGVLSEDGAQIVFTKGDAKVCYEYEIVESEGASILRISQASGPAMRSKIPYLVDLFFIRKFHANPVSYLEYGKG